MPLIDVPTVHAVTDTPILANPGFLDRAAAVFHALGPRGAVHLRGHETTATDLYRLAAALAPLQASTGCWLIVNDRVDVALACGARGAQLAQRSLRLEDARRAGPSLQLGVSIHEVAGAAGVAGSASWVMAGNVYETASHPGRPAKGEAWIQRVLATGCVVVAIGGVLPAHVAGLKALGCHGVATVRIWRDADPAQAAARYL